MRPIERLLVSCGVIAILIAAILPYLFSVALSTPQGSPDVTYADIWRIITGTLP